MSTDPEIRLRRFMAGALRRHAPAIASAWVDAVAERLEVDQRDVLPTAYLLDHIPECLAAIADYLEQPEAPFPTDLVRDEMTALVHRRRKQGFGVRELLAEYEILASLLQDFIERTLRETDFSVDAPTLAGVVGDLKESFATFGLETARSYRIWIARERREKMLQTTTFAAMLRHELRNRLGSAQTAAELLAEESVEAERRERLVGLILRSLEQALDTVDVVKGIMSDVSDAAEPPTWLPLGEILQGIGTSGSAGQPRIELDLGEQGNALVPGSRVSMVLLNLVDNALKYHHEEGTDRWVRITAREAPSDVVARRDDEGSWLLVSVADNGPGIAPALQGSVFEFSVRGDDAEAGSGLGLALSRDIVRQLGGEAWLDGEPGTGTRVSFTVPSRRPEP